LSAQPERVELIAIDRIHILNPRSRGEQGFQDMVENIAAIGLKRPITVSRREDESGPCYDLVCGQGRLEAYAALGQDLIPAFVVEASREDCLVASLVENCARRHHNPVDLLQEIGRLEEAGYSQAEIAGKIGLSHEYVSQISQLLAKGERRLVAAVEAGTMPLSVATEIAGAEEEDVQAALHSAYESGLLKGRKLIAARRVAQARRSAGKSIAPGMKEPPRRLTAEALVRALEEDSERKQALIRRSDETEAALALVVEALRRLTGDPSFVALLEAEELDTLPQKIAARIANGSGRVE
jgi:ParB family chromosome partitioning protein